MAEESERTVNPPAAPPCNPPPAPAGTFEVWPPDVPPPQPPRAGRISQRRLILAFAIAGVSDVVSGFLAPVPPADWAVDFVTALLLFAVLGWRWLLLPGLIMEAIPGVSVFPFWVLVVAAIAIWGTARPKLN